MSDFSRVSIILAMIIALFSIFLDQFTSFDIQRIVGISILTDEDRAIELASAILWLYAAVIVVFARHIQPSQSRLLLSALFLLLCARELDFDKRFFSEGVLKSRQYFGDTPFPEKIIGLGIIALLLLIIILLIKRHWSAFTQAIRSGMTWGWLTLAALFMVVIAKSIDGAERKLAAFGTTLSRESYHFITLVEEYLELGFVFSIIILISLGIKKGHFI
ncbi:MAG: hypothetical protein OXC62_11745 [Aestuariivita sp.]|nr:hypothetical protein [Aestuariivita sp.]